MKNYAEDAGSMGSACIEKLPCPACGSSDSIQAYLNIDEDLGVEWYTSFCHGACWENKGDPYTGTIGPTVHIKSESEIQAEIDTVRSCPIFAPKKAYRGIPPQCYKRWGCRTLYSEFDGRTPYAIGFPLSGNGDLLGWKCRPFKKKDFYGIGRTANTDPFGFARAIKFNTEVLWWTEGEFDAIALEYSMILASEKDRYPVISLTHGGGSIRKNFEEVEDRVGHIKWHVLVLDDDEVGHLAEETAIEMWPDKIIVIRKPKGCKDANDAVKAGLAVQMGKLALNFER